MNHAKIIAEAIPAHSNPAGFGALINQSIQSIDLNATMRDAAVWPDEGRETRKRNRWLHGDYSTPAYVYVYRLFEKCVELGAPLIGDTHLLSVALAGANIPLSDC